MVTLWAKAVLQNTCLVRSVPVQYRTDLNFMRHVGEFSNSSLCGGAYDFFVGYLCDRV